MFIISAPVFVSCLFFTQMLISVALRCQLSVPIAQAHYLPPEITLIYSSTVNSSEFSPDITSSDNLVFDAI